MAITLEKRNPTNIILIVLLLVAAGAAGYFYWNFNEVTRERDQISTRFGLLEQDRSRVMAELDKAKAEIADYQKKIDDLSQQVASANKGKEMVEAELQQKIDDISGLQKRYEKRIQELENEVKQYADFNEMLKKSLEPIQGVAGDQASAQAQGSAASSEKSSAAVPSIFSVQSVTTPDARVELATGQVISIDREYGFAVVNIGSASGVKSGGIVELYHQDKLLGVGNVERAQDKISAVSIVSEDLRARIQKGDRAVLLS